MTCPFANDPRHPPAGCHLCRADTRDQVEHVVVGAFDALEETVAGAGASVHRLIFLGTFDDFDPGVFMQGRGFEGPVDLLSWLIARTMEVADRMGVDMQIMPLAPKGYG